MQGCGGCGSPAAAAMRSELAAAEPSEVAEPLRSSEPLAGLPAAAAVSSPGRAASLLEEATDLLVLHRDFAAALERCEAGCGSLGPAGAGAEAEAGAEAGSSAEVKCSLCVVGIQALAEMNRWREVLPWVLQYYRVPEHLPAKVLELCILLYSRVREPQVMLEVGSSWLRDTTNKSLPEYGSLLELYLLRVLLPLGQFEGAEELVRGCEVLDSAQQLAFLRTICESQCQWTQQEEMHSAAEEQQGATRETVLGAVPQKLLTMLTLLRRALRSISSHFYLIPYKKMLLAAFMLYLVVRLDPANKVQTVRDQQSCPRPSFHLNQLELLQASPTSLPFLYRLVQLFRQAWAAVFPPIRKPPVQD